MGLSARSRAQGRGLRTTLTLGHAAGDDLLRQVPNRLATVTRDGDLIARVGGDEFAIIAPGADPGQARALAERVVGRVGQPYILLGSPTEAGTSVGIKAVAHGEMSNGAQCCPPIGAQS